MNEHLIPIGEVPERHTFTATITHVCHIDHRGRRNVYTSGAEDAKHMGTYAWAGRSADEAGAFLPLLASKPLRAFAR
jgi:hypothetical protein